MFKEHKGSLNTKKNLKGRFCHRPFTTMEIHTAYKAFACCPSWLPKIIGDCKKEGVERVWKSQTAREVRESIIDGSFRFCDHMECPEIQQDSLPFIQDLPEHVHRYAEDTEAHLESLPTEIALCYDESCNLACPSCRTGKSLDIRGKSYNEKLKFTERLIETINDPSHAEQELILRVTGSGDAFAAPIYFRFLQGLNGQQRPNLKIILQTNGILMTPQNWERIENIHQNINAISISIDAASEGSYLKIRRLGNWQKLHKNLYFINDIVRDFKVNQTMQHFCLNFVVQKDNFREIGDFVRMAKVYPEVTEVFFSFVNDWDTWSREEYETQCIWKTYHPQFQEFLSVLKDPILDDPVVKLGNLTAYRKRALSETPAELEV